MELDKKIKDIDTIQTILKHNSNDIGRKGYFFDEFVDTKDLSRCCCYGELIEVDFGRDQNDLCFKAKLENGNTNFFRFFISEADLKPVEKKYRAFKDHDEYAEFLNNGIIESFVKIRRKGSKKIYTLMYVGGTLDIVYLGVYSFTLDYLFEDFELFF